VVSTQSTWGIYFGMGEAPLDRKLSFEEDLWDLFETVCGRLQQASAFETAFATLFSSYAKETREFAKKLLLLTKAKEEDEFYSLKLGWLSAKQELDKISNLYLKLADDITYKVSQPVENHQKETLKVKKKGKETGRKLISDLTEQVKVLAATKAEYEKCMRVLDQSKADYERAQNLNELYNSTKVKKKLDGDKKKADSAEKRYRRAVTKTQNLEVKLFDTEMPQILSSFENMERTRISTIKNSLTAFSMSQQDTIPQLQEICSTISQEVDKIQPDADVDQFILDKRSGRVKQCSRTEYEEYSSQHKSCVKPGSLGGSSSSVESPVGSPMVSRDSGSVPSVNLAKEPLPSDANRMSQPNLQPVNYTQPANYQSMSPAPSGDFRSMATQPVAQPPVSQPPRPASMIVNSGNVRMCRGLHDYTGTQPNELSFRAGDLIKIIEKDPSGWWVGELNGKMGFFPSTDWVEEVTTPSPVVQQTPSAPTPLPTPQQTYQNPYASVQVMNPNPVAYPPQQTLTASVPQYPSFPPQQQASPAPVVQQQAAPPPIPNRGRRGKAIFEMAAMSANELSLKEGDILFIESEADGWYFGSNTRGERGMFPSSFVVLDP